MKDIKKPELIFWHFRPKKILRKRNPRPESSVAAGGGVRSVPLVFVFTVGDA
jgi:hypothetical protein